MFHHIILVATLSVTTATSVSEQEVCKPAHEKEARQRVAVLNSNGETLVRFTEFYVFLEPVLWHTIDYERKRVLTIALAVYHNCVWRPANVKDRRGRPEKKKKRDNWLVTVKDGRTGKKLGSIGLLGFKVH